MTSTSRSRLVVEPGGVAVRFTTTGDNLTAAQVLAAARSLRPVDAAWMVAHCP